MKSCKLVAGGIFTALLAAGCGVLERDDNTSTSGPGNSAPDFSFTGAEFSDVSSSDVAALVNSSQLIRTFRFNSLDLSARVVAAVGGISRGKNPNFATCVKSFIDNTELQTTVDTVGYSLNNVDFITKCDSPAAPEDLVGDVENTLTATMTIGCAGGKTLELKGKSIKDLNVSICSGSQSATYSYSFTLKARNTTKTKKGTEFAVTSARTVLLNESVSAPNGLPCNLVVENEKASRLPGCRTLTQSKTFNNDPKYEANSPKDQNQPHPIVFQAAITVENASIDLLAPFYNSANTSFKFNGWEGNVTYPNGWASPKWEAVVPNTSAKAGGEIGKN